MNISLCCVPLLAVLLAGTGCEATKLPESYNLRLQLSDSLRDGDRYPAVDVFVKGVSEWERQRDWTQRPNITDYPAYRGADVSGADANSTGARVLTLGGDKPPQITLFDGNGAWRAWSSSNATWLIVIANYPRSKPGTGVQDRRMLILPLDRAQYPDNNLQIEVTANGLDVRTPPRAPAH